MRLLGIDFGEKRVGLAITDDDCKIASSWKTITYSKNNYQYLIDQIKKLIKPYEIKSIILGYPLHLSGKESKTSKKVLIFKKFLENNFHFKVILWDERNSTIQTTSYLKDFLKLKNSKVKKIIDKMSAQHILEDYLNSK